MTSSDAATPEEYIAELDEPRRDEIARLDELIRAKAPDLDPHMRSGMLGYGSYHYRYASGKEGEWFVIGLASQERYLSLYVCATDGDENLAERYGDRLPKADIGRSCVRFKRLSDVDLETVGEMVSEAARLGGMAAA